MWKVRFLAVLVPLFLLAGWGGPTLHAQPGRVEVYRTAPPLDPVMVDLCRHLQRTTDQASIHTRSELEEYRTETSSGEERGRQYHERSRYAEAARIRDEMLVLCAELGYPLR